MEKEVQTMADMLKVNQMFFEICVTELMTNWQQYKQCLFLVFYVTERLKSLLIGHGRLWAVVCSCYDNLILLNLGPSPQFWLPMQLVRASKWPCFSHTIAFYM